MKIYSQDNFKSEKMFKVFCRDVKGISDFIKENKKEINSLNTVGVSSKKIQDFLKNKIVSIGYSYEVRQDLFQPDFIKIMKEGSIVIEVERGKTINNNMDFIDFWKCHIHNKVSCLILIVPERVPRKGASHTIYNMVARRMEPLFKIANYTNVRALAIIDY